MIKILLVEDEKNLGLSLSEFLHEKYGFCHWVTNSKDAQDFIKRDKIDLALLDIGLPDGDGISLAKLLKQKQTDLKFLFLSALNDPETKVAALELGGLDYITKPFALKELTLRLDRIFGERSKVYTFGKLHFNPQSYEVTYKNGDKEILATKECLILKMLLEKTNQVLSRDEIIKAVWGENAFPSNRTVDNYIVKLRRWCESDPSSKIEIQSIRGIGYMFTQKEK